MQTDLLKYSVTFFNFQIQCTVTNEDNTIDLSPLVNSQGYFLATSLDDSNPTPYYINLCHPLNPIPGIRCPAGAAACKVDGNKITVSSKTLNHGYVCQYVSFEPNS